MELILIISMAWWLVNFEPLQLAIDGLFTKLPVDSLTAFMHAALGCWKCWSFWLTIFITVDFSLACFAALLTFIFDLCLSKLK
jgi:hypothetical protein